MLQYNHDTTTEFSYSLTVQLCYLKSTASDMSGTNASVTALQKIFVKDMSGPKRLSYSLTDEFSETSVRSVAVDMSGLNLFPRG